MKKILNNSYINLILRLVLGIIFLFAASSKIANPASFAADIANFRIIPGFAINVFALALPWIELVCAIFIISGIRLKSSSAIIGILILVFNVAIIIAMAKGLNINCGCHTKVMAEQVGWKKLIENTALLISALYIFYSKGTKISLESYIIRKSAFAKMAVFRNLN